MKLKTPSDTSISRSLNTLLEGHISINSLSEKKCYARVQDDCDGIKDYSQSLSVIIAHDSDLWVSAGGSDSLRFRVPFFGGGMSFRVRNALLVLAEAIRRDNVANPILETVSPEDYHYDYRKPTIKVLVSCPLNNDLNQEGRSVEVDTGLNAGDLHTEGSKVDLIEQFKTLYGTLWQRTDVDVVFSSKI